MLIFIYCFSHIYLILLLFNCVRINIRILYVITNIFIYFIYLVYLLFIALYLTMTTQYNNKPKRKEKMNILDFIHGVQKLQSHSETLDEIKKILHNDGTINIVEQVKHLQENTSVKNINLLSKRLSRLDALIDEIESEYSYAYDEVSSAIGNLESVASESDYCYDARNMISDLRQEILDADSDLNKEEDSDNNTAQPSA